MNTTLSDGTKFKLVLPHNTHHYVQALNSITHLLEEKSTDKRYLGTTELLIWEIFSAFVDQFEKEES